MVRFLDYPEREPMSAVAAAYHKRCLELGENVRGQAHHYGPGVFQSLLVHRSDNPSGEALLVFHGGGWTHGYKEWMSMMAPPLNSRGVTLITAGYRLAPENVFPVGLHDCAAALAWVTEHLEQIGASADRVFVGGHSAGAHYASLLALERPQVGRPRIAGCLPISGVYELGGGSGIAQQPRFLGESPSADVCRQASPIHQPLSGAPPFFISWGENDFPHLKVQAEQMVEALRQAGGRVCTLELAGCDHFQASYAAAEAHGVWVERAVDFMRNA